MSYAYSVAIRLSVANLASQGIKLLAGDLLNAHGAAVKLSEKLSALKLAAVGYGLDRIGHGIFGFLEKSVDASKEYTRQLSLMNAAGMTQKDIAESITSAWQTSREVVTSTAADNLRMIRELRSVLGKDRLSEAYAALPIAQRVKATLEALTGKEQENIGFQMVKVGDLRTSGLMSKETVTRNMELMGRTLMAMGGTLDVRDFLMTLKYAKTAALSFSDEFVYKYLPTLMQEVKAGGSQGTSTAGTALATLYSTIVQGRIPKSALPIWEAVGLVKPSDVVRNATGGYQVRPGGVQGSKIFQENPFFFAESYAPILQKYATAHHLNLLELISDMFPARNAAWMMNTLIVKAAQAERDRALIEASGNSYQTYQKLMQTNPQLAETALHSQWQNIQAQIGYSILPRLIPYMVKFADALDGISKWMSEHPNLTTGLVIGLGSLSIALSAVGKILMTVALVRFLGLGAALAKLGAVILPILGPIGLVVGALALIGVAAYEVWKHWDYIGPKLKAAWESIKSGVSGLLDWIKAKWEWVTGLFQAKQTGGATGHWDSGATGSWGDPKSSSDQSSASSGNRSPYIASGSKMPLAVHTQINMDGRKVAETVTRHQVDAGNRPQTGLSSFDGSMSLAPAGSGGY